MEDYYKIKNCVIKSANVCLDRIISLRLDNGIIVYPVFDTTFGPRLAIKCPTKLRGHTRSRHHKTARISDDMADC